MPAPPPEGNAASVEAAGGPVVRIGDTALLGVGAVLSFGGREVAKIAKGSLSAEVTGFSDDTLTVRALGRTKCTPAGLDWAGIDFVVARGGPVKLVSGRLTYEETCEHIDPPEPEPHPPGYLGRTGGPRPGHMVERGAELTWGSSGERAGVLLQQHLFTADPREVGESLCFDPSTDHVKFQGELCVPKAKAKHIKIEGTIGLGNLGKIDKGKGQDGPGG